MDFARFVLKEIGDRLISASNAVLLVTDNVEQEGLALHVLLAWFIL